MSKKLAKLGLMFAALSFGAAQAHAARENNSHEVSIERTGSVGGVIKVISVDGKKWLKAEVSEVRVPLRIFARAGYGYLHAFRIGLGRQRMYSWNYDPGVATTVSRALTTKGNTQSVDIQGDVTALCNEQTRGSRGAGKTHDLTYNAPVQFTVFFGANGQVDANGEPVYTRQDRTITVPVKVKCIRKTKVKIVNVSLVKTSSGDKCPQKWQFRAKLRSNNDRPIKIFLTSQKGTWPVSTVIPKRAKPVPAKGMLFTAYYSKDLVLDSQIHSLIGEDFKYKIQIKNGESSAWKHARVGCPNQEINSMFLKYQVSGSPTCPKRVTEKLSIYTNRPGPVSYEIKHQLGMVLYRGVAEAKREGDDYIARAARNFQQSAFDADVMGVSKDDNSANTGWTRLKVECAPHEGDSGSLAEPQLPNPDAPRPTWAGELTIADSATGRDVSCPRAAQIVFKARRAQAGNFKYRMSCSNGKLFKGTATSYSQGSGWEAVGAHNLNITRSRRISCNLQEIRPSGAPVSLAQASREFTCITPTGGQGSNDLTVEPTPPAGASDNNPGGRIVEPLRPPLPPTNTVPGRIVDPVRTVSCVGGIVRNRSCYCPRTHKKVSVGPNAWRCDRKMVVDPVRPGGQTGVPGASPDTNPVGGQPTRANPTATGGQPTRANPDADKRRLEELKKKQAEQKRAAELIAKRKAAAAAAATAKKKAAAAAKKKTAAAAKKKAAAAKKKAAAAAKKKVAAAAKKKAIAAKKKVAAAAKKKAAAAKKKSKKKGKKKGKGFVAQ